MGPEEFCPMSRPHIQDPEVQTLQRLVTSQEPKPADVIVWLQGNGYDRGASVLALYQKKFAPLIMVTGNNTRVVDNDRVRVADIQTWLIDRWVPAERILIDAEAFHTLDQAIHVMKKAKENQWNRILLVGSTHHQLRAFLTFLHQAKCLHWNGEIVNQPAHIDWHVKPSGRKKTSVEALGDEIAKLSTYTSIATIADGIKNISHEY